MARGMKVEYSLDGKTFRKMGEVTNKDPWNINESTYRREFTVTKPIKARYIRVTGISQGTCPVGHAGEGGKAWLFCDEITFL
jgi:hypothetical protein